MNTALLQMTADLAAAYLRNNTVAMEDVPGVITSIYQSLVNAEAAPTATETVEPFVSVKQSVKEDHLVCLCCGKHLKSLKRHVQTAHGMTVEAYKATFGLPVNYPTVAPAYSVRRSSLAKQIGLGHKRGSKVAAAA
jgi:predicted transcriptional regulator